MANKYQNSSQNKATKNLNQTHRTARQASNLESNQTSSQNTRLASGLQRSISRLARKIKKAKPKLVLSLAFLVALPLIALGVFFGTGLNQEFGASALNLETVVLSDNIQTITLTEDGQQITQVSPDSKNSIGSSYCNIGDLGNYKVDQYLKENDGQWEKNIASTRNNYNITICRIVLTGHEGGFYTSPDTDESIKDGTTDIQLILRQDGVEDKLGNCGVYDSSSNNYDTIVCLHWIKDEGGTTIPNISNEPKQISLNSFSPGIVEVFLKFANDGNKEIRIMEVETYIEPVPGCRSPFASNYNGNAIPPKEGEEDVTCEISLNINHIKLEE